LFRAIQFLLAPLIFAITPAHAVITLIVDDFEEGVGKWALNDKIKAASPSAAMLPVSLVNVIGVPPETGGVRGSKGAALFTFKAAKASWATASVPIDGKAWATAGAQNLSFWLNAGGETKGFDVILRGRTYDGNGALVEEKFVVSKKVDLDRRAWRQVSIPLSEFRSERGTLPSRMAGLYLLQFAQLNDWDARFFMVDDIRVDGSGKAIPQVAAINPPTTAPITRQPIIIGAQSGPVTTVNVDFLKKEGKIRSAANVSLGMTWPNLEGVELLPLDNPAYRDSLAVLKPRLIRLEAGSLATLVDSSKPSFDFSRLSEAVKQVRALKAEPLIALTNPAAWGLDAQSYASYAAQAARASNRDGSTTRLFEIALGAFGSVELRDDGEIVNFYNRAYDALKAASREYWVGGVGASGGRANTLRRLLGGAKGLDFLSVNFTSPVQSSEARAIFISGENQTGVKYAAAQLDKSRFKRAPLFVTQANLSGPGPDGAQPADARANEMASAAWWITFLSAGSRVADQVFHNDAANASWGLLDGANVSPRGYPAFYALYLWNNFVPGGSERVKADVSNGAIEAIALNAPPVNSQPIHSILLTNTTENEQTVKVSIRGFPVLREVRTRVFDDLATARGLTTYQVLSKSPFQTMTLKPFAVVLLQFIEPPKK
jgi:hypothetical protein